MQFKDRLKEARSAARLTQKAVADHFGLQPQSVSEWERGESRPDQEKLPALARLYGRSTDWLLDGTEIDLSSEDVAAGLDRPPKRRIKIKGYVGAGGEAHYYALAQGDLDEIEASGKDGPKAVAVQIKGPSLGRLFNGWYAVYDDVRRPVTEDLIGRVCVVGLKDERVLVKKLERGGNGRYDLFSETEPPIKGVQIEWAAKVTDIRSP